MRLVSFLALLLMPLALLSQVPSTPQPSPTVPNIPDANPDLVQLVIQDQWDRGNDMFGGKQIPPPDQHGKSVHTRDEERKAAARKLLSEGKIKSGADFWFAALIFQHSEKSADTMLAHILAGTAAAKGNNNGKWLSAATLDRFLWQTHQSQIFGTQFQKDAEGKWTMEPYAREALSDTERAIWCVVPLAEQNTILNDFRDGKPLAPTDIRNCK